MEMTGELLQILDECQTNKGGKNARKRKEASLLLHGDKEASGITTYNTSAESEDTYTIKEVITETKSTAKAKSASSTAENGEEITLTYNGEELTEEDADKVFSNDFSEITCKLLSVVIKEANNYNLGEVAVPKRLLCAICGHSLVDYIEFEKELEKELKTLDEIKFEYTKVDADGNTTEEGHYYLIYDIYEDTNYLVINYIKDMLEYNLSDAVKEAWEVFRGYIDKTADLDDTIDEVGEEVE